MNGIENIEIVKNNASALESTNFESLSFGSVFSDHMFTADYENGNWGNCRIIPSGTMEFHPAMASLHYGQAIFEGLKAYRHKNGKISVFRPDKNASRFNRSAERLCMPEFPEKLFIQSITALIKTDEKWIPEAPDHALYIRPLMIATDSSLSVQPSKTYKYIVLTSPVGPYFSKPLRIKIEKKFTRAAQGGMGFAKAAGNYAGSMFPALKAAEEGFDQMIWTDGQEHLYIEEMGAANVMFLLGDKLVTPSVRDTILDGVTRDTILTLARRSGITIEERRVSVSEIVEGAKNKTLTEAFGVGTAYTIAPINSISYEDEEYFLNAPEQRTFSKEMLKQLNAIRYGDAPDVYNWNYPV